MWGGKNILTFLFVKVQVKMSYFKQGGWRELEDRVGGGGVSRGRVGGSKGEEKEKGESVEEVGTLSLLFCQSLRQDFSVLAGREGDMREKGQDWEGEAMNILPFFPLGRGGGGGGEMPHLISPGTDFLDFTKRDDRE